MPLLVTANFTFNNFVELPDLDDSVLALVAIASATALFRARQAHEVSQVAMRWAGQTEL